LRMLSEIDQFSRLPFPYKGEIQISGTVKNSASTRQPPDHRNFFLNDEGKVHFCKCILMLPNHDRCTAVPKHTGFIRHMPKHILLKREIEIRVRYPILYEFQFF